jgi:hypothetical protein
VRRRSAPRTEGRDGVDGTGLYGAGPGGEQWEVYTVLADSDTFGPNIEQPDQTCLTQQQVPQHLHTSLAVANATNAVSVGSFDFQTRAQLVQNEANAH